jgi:hypothetical protein
MKKCFLLFTMMLATTMGLLAQGTTWETATLIGNGSTKTGTLDNVTTEQWYKINVTTEGTVNFTATATQTLTFYAYYCTFNGYKNDNIYSRGSFTGNSSSSSTTTEVTFQATDVGKGTYYIRIRRYAGTGSYTLKYTFTESPTPNDQEPNNEYTSAKLIASGSTVPGRIGYRTSDDVTDTDDWYKIVVPEEGQIELMATATGSARFYPYYCTVNGYKNNNIYSRGSFTGNTSSASQTDTITFKATDIGAGTYYIRISRYPGTGSGGYYLSYRFTPCPMAADPEPNNEYQRYCRLLNGKTTQGRMGYRTSDDVTDTDDWYRIIVPKDGPVDIKVTATETLKLYPYESKICRIQDNNIYNVSSFTGNNSSSTSDTLTYQNNNMAAGVYYIKIHRYSGSGGYKITYNGPISDIPGDVDGDGEVGIADISELTDFLLYGGSTGGTLANGDADGDGQITIADVTALIDKLLGN